MGEERIYVVPVVWQVTGKMKIRASSLEEAEEKALGPEPLPEKSDYLTESIELDKEHPDYGKEE